MLAWLLQCRCLARYCLRPREDGMALVSNAPPILPAPNTIGSAPSKISRFSELRGRFRANTLYLAKLAYLPKLSKHTCGRLTDLTREGFKKTIPHNIEPLPGSTVLFVVNASVFLFFKRILVKDLFSCSQKRLQPTRLYERLLTNCRSWWRCLVVTTLNCGLLVAKCEII
jgi:hypothetical protein